MWMLANIESKIYLERKVLINNYKVTFNAYEDGYESVRWRCCIHFPFFVFVFMNINTVINAFLFYLLLT